MVEFISSFLVDADEWIYMWIKVSSQHRKDCLIENDAIQNWAAAVLEFNKAWYSDQCMQFHVWRRFSILFGEKNDTIGIKSTLLG